MFFAGTGASAPSARRGLSATLLRAGGDRILVDCGEGTQRQLVKTVGLPEIDVILITHLHADHWLGLPGMLKTYDLRDRERPLELFGPPGLKAMLDRIQPTFGKLGYPLDIAELDVDESLRFDGYRIQTFATRHRGARSATCSWRTIALAVSMPTSPVSSAPSPAPSSGSCSAASRCAGSIRHR